MQVRIESGIKVVKIVDELVAGESPGAQRIIRDSETERNEIARRHTLVRIQHQKRCSAREAGFRESDAGVARVCVMRRPGTRHEMSAMRFDERARVVGAFGVNSDNTVEVRRELRKRQGKHVRFIAHDVAENQTG